MAGVSPSCVLGSSVLIWCGGLVCRWGHFSLQILPSWSPAVETASALLENLCVLFTLSGDSPNLQAAHGTNAPPYHQAFEVSADYQPLYSGSVVSKKELEALISLIWLLASVHFHWALVQRRPMPDVHTRLFICINLCLWMAQQIVFTRSDLWKSSWAFAAMSRVKSVF